MPVQYTLLCLARPPSPFKLLSIRLARVPLFVSTGEKVKVDTRDGRYLGRVNG